MVYAAEQDYQEYLMGRKPVIRTGFDFYARQASQVIDVYTFGRVKNLLEVPEPVRLCCCELAEAIYQREKRSREAAGKTSEKVGTYSVSFSSDSEARQAADREQRGIVMKWLADTGLCYQGV